MMNMGIAPYNITSSVSLVIAQRLVRRLHDCKRAVHPGVTPAQVQEATGFALHIPADVPETAAPTENQLALLARLDPHNLRASVLS